MENSFLRKLQLTELEILKVFDSFCQEHNLKYSLYAGSLLGAVRHKGFIPWDDDLDVCMARDEYERFLALWTQDHPKGYVLQNKENSPHFTQSFTKLRKDHTTFLQDASEAGKYHTGIFMDIFPIDRIPSGKIARYIFLWNCMVYQLLTREFAPPNASRFVRAGSKVILSLIPQRYRKTIRHHILRRITKYNKVPVFETLGIETMDTLKQPFTSDMLNTYINLQFEGSQFMCFAEWDTNLRQHFGDYMQLPPEEDRAWKHHPIIIDFEHNYEELNLSE